MSCDERGGGGGARGGCQWGIQGLALEETSRSNLGASWVEKEPDVGGTVDDEEADEAQDAVDAELMWQLTEGFSSRTKSSAHEPSH